MKRIRLIIASILGLAIGSSTLFAQSIYYEVEEYTPTVYMTIKDKRACETHHKKVVDDFTETHRHGFQQAANPQFIFSTQDNKFALGIGGFVNLRTSYDFDGAMGNIDFIPYDIPMSKGYANRQRVMMDASTSRLFLKAVVKNEMLGRVVIYTDMDFRGGEQFSYLPRLRSAYVSFKGLTIGRDVTTFCDLNAAPMTVDFQGPNAYNFAFNEMIRYEYSFLRNHFTLGVAAEMPSVNGTYGEHFSPIYQRVPDGIAYLQYAWGENHSSHLRVSGVIRDMYLHDNKQGENTTQLGWGVQLSGHIDIGRWVDIYMNGVYGRGITPYIQDLAGSPYDFAYDPKNPERMQTMPMWGWQAAAQLNIVPGKFWLAGGYSEVGLEENNGYLSTNEYSKGQYLFGNAFCKATPNITFALEYLHGTREDMGGSKSRANRISIMAQYNF